MAQGFASAGVLDDIGPWKPWTVGYTNFTPGDGTLTFAEYAEARSGLLIIARFHFVFGSTTTIDAADPRFSTPVTPHADYTSTDPIGNARMLDAGLDDFIGTVRILSGDFNVQCHETDAAHGKAGFISATVPFTWTTTDAIAFEAIFQPA